MVDQFQIHLMATLRHLRQAHRLAMMAEVVVVVVEALAAHHPQREERRRQQVQDHRLVARSVAVSTPGGVALTGMATTPRLPLRMRHQEHRRCGTRHP